MPISGRCIGLRQVQFSAQAGVLLFLIINLRLEFAEFLLESVNGGLRLAARGSLMQVKAREDHGGDGQKDNGDVFHKNNVVVRA